MSVIRRLPKYYRYLTELMKKSVNRISSKELSKKMGFTASQVRQDLNCFGEFGQQGYGYCVPNLQGNISDILGINNDYKAILIGVGNLGRAIISHIQGHECGFSVMVAFDKNEEIIGSKVHDVMVEDIKNIESICETLKPKVAVLCLPQTESPKVVRKLYDFGIKNYLNFSHYDIAVDYPDTIVENVHISDSLRILCYRITTDDSANKKTKA